MGQSFPSTYGQVVANMRKIKHLVDNYLSKLISTIFDSSAVDAGTTDIYYNEAAAKLQVIGTTIRTDAEGSDLGPSAYGQNLTWESKLSAAVGLDDLLNVGERVTLMTTRVVGVGAWQVAYTDQHMATYFRVASSDTTWGEWESVGRKQFMESATRPSDNAQDIGDYWLETSTVPGIQYLWRKTGTNSYTRIYPHTTSDAVQVGADSTLTDTLNEIIEDASESSSELSGRINTLDTKVERYHTELGTKITTEVSAAKTDLESQISTASDTLDTKINGVSTTLTNRINSTQGNVDSLDTKVEQYHTELGTKITTDVSAAKTELESQISSTSSTLDTKIDNVSTTLTNQINTTQGNIDTLRTQIEQGTVGAAVHVGSTAPSNTKCLWIDTSSSVTGGLKYHNGNGWVHVPVAYST